MSSALIFRDGHSRRTGAAEIDATSNEADETRLNRNLTQDRLDVARLNALLSHDERRTQNADRDDDRSGGGNGDSRKGAAGLSRELEERHVEKDRDGDRDHRTT